MEVTVVKSFPIPYCNLHVKRRIYEAPLRTQGFTYTYTSVRLVYSLGFPPGTNIGDTARTRGILVRWLNNSTRILASTTRLIPAVSRGETWRTRAYFVSLFPRSRITRGLLSRNPESLPWLRTHTNKFPARRTSCSANICITLRASTINLYVI